MLRIKIKVECTDGDTIEAPLEVFNFDLLRAILTEADLCTGIRDPKERIFREQRAKVAIRSMLNANPSAVTQGNMVYETNNGVEAVRSAAAECTSRSTLYKRPRNRVHRSRRSSRVSPG